MSSLDSIDDPSSLSDAQRARIKAELVPGERLLWSSKGSFSDSPGCSPTSMIILGILFCLISSFLFAFFFRWIGLPNDDRSEITLLFAIGFGVVGIIILLAHFVEWPRNKKKTRWQGQHLYVLTDRRAIFWRPDTHDASALEIISVFAGQVTNISRIEKSKSLGDVVFWISGYFPFFVEETVEYRWLRFNGIDDLRRVEDLARRVLLPEYFGPVSIDTVEGEIDLDRSHGPEARSGEL